jgi:tetratricopeptide (TPR) repeat protein
MSLRTTAVALMGCLAAAACAPTHPKIGTTEITSVAILTSYQESEAAAKDLVQGRSSEALARAEHAVRLAPWNPYAHYDRAVALRRLGRTDAAVAAFREAERRFGNADRHGKAISIYGRARALDDVGRCSDASVAYTEFSRFTSVFDPAASKMALGYAQQCRQGERVLPDPAMTELATAVITHEYERALEASEHVAKPARASGWVDYNRAVALAGLGRIEEALAAYRAAEERFGSAEPEHRAIAIYGRARALDQSGRCAEARRVYAEYADLVRQWSPADAARAEKIARACRG